MIRTRIRFAVACALVLFVCVSSAPATIINLEANLDGLQVVSPNSSPAFGLADATLDDVTGAFTIVTGTYQDLLGGATAVLLNDAPPGSNGPFIMALTLDTPGATTGTFSGGGVLTAPQMADMIAGNTYIRVNSQVYPSAEIRGQFAVVPEPGSVILLGLGVIGVLALAWRRAKRVVGIAE